MNKRIILTAAVFGALAVILGAFGAHGLRDKISAESITIWNKGVEYQFYHTFALLFLSTFVRFRNKLIDLAYFSFSFGILLFSGSLYLLASKSITNIGFINYIWPITPLGGLLLILGWMFLFLAALRHR
ncbi:DUF423 domain-containing protein [Pedobacter sp. MC2016-14]|uniref:DUF423 domain-containing protein n=1 Tax=Pedobacter sp. MC2016-14 TaxID=2897327 RepID=UPI001E511BF4|nr:DUF423 domain-containing protein [Pedobacter sp. MC2016-14]MCD0489589.1 DUF423 domain-containing protein [Pedobacter sp. MC2016-14]